ncbi:MAG TPA: HD domain-containing protein [Candidatus Ruthenibacterium merdavium]|uniref:HD domain-containing protein n=1 Tax=Candidatus Ruthenibacterium merdavium TaxID=2838752 RepID=A0A9D2Q690_9FIRM|nr:HD domain-containing protein [Candidatus Ruthenibacterium merdavium]
MNEICAKQALREAGQRNPGPWIGHSESVAQNAKLIAQRCGLDAQKAYVMGLLHDIGRREGVSGIKHIFDGYAYMLEMGEKEIARICLTHSFPLKDVQTYIGAYDCTEEELAFLRDFLEHTEQDDYDRLIQLCDAISLPEGACIMEKRLMDVALRHGLPEFSLDKWRAFLALKQYFDDKCGCNLYEFLPNVFKNSIGPLL